MERKKYLLWCLEDFLEIHLFFQRVSQQMVSLDWKQRNSLPSSVQNLPTSTSKVHKTCRILFDKSLQPECNTWSYMGFVLDYFLAGGRM